MTPEQPDPREEDVRRLLAEAGGATDPLPEDVVGRLDDVLAGLVADRRGASPAATASVVDLTERRARRWPRVLVAAALVGVVGVGLGNLVNQDTMSDNASAGATADQAESESRDTLEGHAGEDAGPASDSDRPDAGLLKDDRRSDAVTGKVPLLRLRTASLTSDVERVELFAMAMRRSMSASYDRYDDACVEPPLARRDEVLRVRLDGTPAVLVIRAPADGSRLAEVFVCPGDGEPEATTTVTAR